jgi:hypothetical protein
LFQETSYGAALGQAEVARFEEVNSRNVNERDRLEREKEAKFEEAFPEAAKERANTRNWIMSLQTYARDGFETAGVMFGGGNVTVRSNHSVGNSWDRFVHGEMLKNSDYIGVARQITIKVVGTINGQQYSAKIRVDNVGIFKDANGQARFDLMEAKYSVKELTLNNIKQTFTSQQGKAFNLVVEGENVVMTLSKGQNSAKQINDIMINRGGLNFSGNLVKPGQNITGNINQIQIAAPTGSQPQIGPAP